MTTGVRFFIWMNISATVFACAVALIETFLRVGNWGIFFGPISILAILVLVGSVAGILSLAISSHSKKMICFLILAAFLLQVFLYISFLDGEKCQEDSSFCWQPGSFYLFVIAFIWLNSLLGLVARRMGSRAEETDGEDYNR